VNRLQLALAGRRSEERYSLNEFAQDYASFLYNGQSYLGGLTQTYDLAASGQTAERGDSAFEHWVQAGYKRSGVVFACQLARLMLFAEIRFQFQQVRAGKLGDLFGTPALSILEAPWPNGSTGELLARMIQDVDLAGNAYIRRTGALSTPRLERLRPDWVDIVLAEDPELLTLDVVGYLHWPGGQRDQKPTPLGRGEVAHWSPIPDPLSTYRGMSWLTPVIREIRADGAATDHKQKFFDRNATPNMIIKFDKAVAPEALDRFKLKMEAEHAGAQNAHKNLYLGGGADVTVVGQSFKDMDYKQLMAAGETRIAAAAGVPPVIVGLSEGLEAATYSNYAQARRRFGDMTIRPLWRSACTALATVVRPPENSRLWYDASDISALQEDEKDAAAIFKEKMLTIEAGIRAGFQPDTVTAAVASGDLGLMKHTGLFSVQLQKPGTDVPGSPTAPVTGSDSDDPEGVNA
jgi:HK97 family phage portal protein